MYFWKIDNLKKDLINNAVSENDQFKYIFVFSICSSIVYILNSFPFYHQIENDIWYFYSAIIESGISILGTYYIFKINGGSNGNYFLQRYFSLSWVIGIRLSPFILLAIFVFVMLSIGFGFDDALNDIFLNLGFFSFILIYYWLVGKHAKEVTLKSKNSK